MFKQRKGFIFTMDALLALMIILSIYIISQDIDNSKLILTSNYEEYHYKAEDVTQLLSLASGRTLDESVRMTLINSTNITSANLDESLLDIIGRLWAEGHNSLAENITFDYLDSVLPKTINFELSITSEDINYIIASRGNLNQSDYIASASRLPVRHPHQRWCHAGCCRG